ncbi:MAG TPA: cysteine desulfurase [Gemmatimonadales bacterium]|nr:cysteine desulfurase [Gemmatimonadales bacterium]
MNSTRRQLVGMLGWAALSRRVGWADDSADHRRPTPTDWREHFPALAQRLGGRQLCYLDSAATTLRPEPVIDELVGFYRGDNANPSASLHTLAQHSHVRYEGARAEIARFINAADPNEVVFTRGTTEAINLVASAWGTGLARGDEILLGIGEHSSNLVPWLLLARGTGVVLRFFDLDRAGRVRLDDVARKLTGRTRLLGLAHVSNVLGYINPVGEIASLARARNVRVLVDAAQSVPHIPVDVAALGADFVAFSGHKMLGPMGIGVLWARRAILDAMPPYQGGSNMAHDVGIDPAGLDAHLSSGAHKFGAGTPNVAGALGLAAAVRFLRSIGMGAFRSHEQRLVERGLERLRPVRGIRLLGPVEPEDRIAVFSFTLDGFTVPEVVRGLDAEGIAVRGGDLASTPLLDRFGVRAAIRASCYLYTTTEEIDRLADALHRLTLRRRLLEAPR